MKNMERLESQVRYYKFRCHKTCAETIRALGDYYTLVYGPMCIEMMYDQIKA